MGHAELLAAIDAYYRARLHKFGACAQGVDWNSAESQALRFEQLLKILPSSASPDELHSLNDLGCGYGALLAHLEQQGRKLDYRGYDLSADMIAAAHQRPASSMPARFAVAASCTEVADYSLASGLLNVKQGTDPARWERYIESVLDDLHQHSRLGFAFNCLSRHSDPERMKANLYYGEPGRFLEHCLRRYSRQVALLHDYGLYEFTILVRKAAH